MPDQISDSSGTFTKAKNVGDILRVGDTYGYVYALENLPQTATDAGRISKIYVANGSRVNIGTPLCAVVTVVTGPNMIA